MPPQCPADNLRRAGGPPCSCGRGVSGFRPARPRRDAAARRRPVPDRRIQDSSRRLGGHATHRRASGTMCMHRATWAARWGSSAVMRHLSPAPLTSDRFPRPSAPSRIRPAGRRHCVSVAPADPQSGCPGRPVHAHGSARRDDASHAPRGGGRNPGFADRHGAADVLQRLSSDEQAGILKHLDRMSKEGLQTLLQVSAGTLRAAS